MMNVFGSLLLSSVLLAGFVGSADAGPCSSEIARAQADVDLRVEAAAGAGVPQPESAGAKLHRQPTPDSVAQATRAAGDADNERILALLALARRADELGDRAACEKALEDVRALLR